MFDNINNSVNFPKKIEVEVIENKAPVDDSVRLYKEIESSIHSTLLSKINLKDNLFNIETCNVFFYKSIGINNFNEELTCVNRISLNGVIIDFKFNIEIDRINTDNDVIVKNFKQQYFSKLTEVILHKFFEVNANNQEFNNSINNLFKQLLG